MPVTPGRLLGGRYEIQREVGVGGMATVYAALDRQTGGIVAVKVLKPELAPYMGGDRFAREIRITAQLRHPGIVALLDTGEVDGVPFYTMPFVEGETLSQRLAREKQLALPDALAIMRELTDALAYAHDCGVLHRDIKPANVLLSGGRALLADFGIARAVDAGAEALTETGIAVGTVEYMSPEQGVAEGVDQRSDIYALGCVLYEMLAGAPPFTGSTARAVLARHARDDVPSLRTVRPTVTRRLEAVVSTALAKVPADRFATARDFQAALRDPLILDHTSDIPVGTWTTPVAPPFGRRGLRSAALMLGTVALIAIVTLFARQAAGPTLDPHMVVGFPLVAPAQVGESRTAGEDVATLIGSALDRREALRWVDGWRYLPNAERDVPSAVSAQAMREIARAQGAAWYVTGRIVLRGDSVDVLLDLVDAGADTVAARPRASGAAGALWRVAIRSVNQLLPVLLPGANARDLEGAWVDREPAAVASFLAGEAAFRRARPAAALAHYREAVRDDSVFALAAVRGAQAATAAHQPSEARALVQRALGQTLPPQYAAFARGYAAYLDGRADAAIAAFTEALRADPELGAAWAQLGETYIHLVPLTGAADSLAEYAFAEARRIDSTATHVLLHPIEIAARRGEVARAAAWATRFLAAQPDSTLANQIRLMTQCATQGPGAPPWRTAVRGDPLAVLSVGAVMGVHAANSPCATAAYEAVLDMDSAAAAQPGSVALRQSALVGLVGVRVAQGRADAALVRVGQAVARGDGGASLLMVAAPVAPVLAPAAAEVAARDVERFGADMARCSTPERCWILAQYFAARGEATPVTTIARVLAARARTDSTSELALYAAATEAHARYATGDTAAAVRTLRALLARPLPPGNLLAWTPLGGLGAERVLLARLLLAQRQPRDAERVAESLELAAPASFPLYLRASLEIRIAAATAVGEVRRAARQQARLAGLAAMPAANAASH
ncbi:MAG: protein kinase [Gemmatimonadetes bacterium]|nr:protein kinase [Gemmatimonadota bacterium]